ncbi:hypothetical protein I8752_08605 [Nostocaceae cyanobacterium CENA369]|uniref:Uncharacterized protein n=1 Tax=Dendronalium phyllosphericum CENA369 TaxID=1725256 RepID=A0A8J7LEI6_9NOST|nr:hypothetical protein [Dendronalium phyllosphericum]MBH8573073.1 hypothetical protein [Dendronalium phyllosphericum CENA369]
MRKTTFLTITLSFLVVLPAMAELGQVWTDFESYSTDLQNYLSSNLSDSFKPLEIRTQGSLNGARGEVNIPNPVAAGEQIRDDITLYSLSDKFENNSAVRGISVSNEINRLLTRGSVVGLMGANGQVRLKAKLQNTETTLKNIEEAVRNAEQNQSLIDNLLAQAGSLKPDPTKIGDYLSGQSNAIQPTLLLQSIKIQRDQSKILSETLAQTVQTNQSLQYSNLNLANISQQMEEANRARRVDSATEAARLLRTTSQIDLFGRNLDR